MEAMTLPTPEDPARAPVWENFVIAQVTQAALGRIPRNALALGVEVSGWDVTLRCQLRAVVAEDEADLVDIASDLGGLIGGAVRVSTSAVIRSEPQIPPRDATCWIYVVREEGD